MTFLKALFGHGTSATVEVGEARRMQQHGARLIDVREPHEFAAGHAAVLYLAIRGNGLC